MPLSLPTAEQILDAIRRKPGSEVEELLKEYPALTWNQVFLELDRLSRQGTVRLMRKGRGEYVVLLAALEHAEGGGVTKAR
jgi:uncharacterized membrane protein